MATRSQAYYVGPNALSLFDFTQGESDLLYGFEADAGVSTSISGSSQTVTTGTEGDGVHSKSILFPFEGATLIASADFSAADERFRVGVRFLDADGVLISESQSDFIATGRRSHEATVPADTVYVQWFTARDAVDGADGSWTFTKPALRTTSTAFSH